MLAYEMHKQAPIGAIFSKHMSLEGYNVA